MNKYNIALMFILSIVVAMMSGCSRPTVPALKPLNANAVALLAQKGMTQQAPIFMRIFKEESELEIWKKRDDGRFHLFKTYPICKWSGKLGPKVKTGDKQAPEGFYRVSHAQLNPNSKFHLSFNLGYPNAFDKANGRTGAHLMVHGSCSSAGCYAMTDALVEEIYILAREAFVGGQRSFKVHAFPFRMTAGNMKRHHRNKWYSFWRQIKEGYDIFEISRIPPKVYVCEKQYLLNVSFLEGRAPGNPAGFCPPFQKTPLDRNAVSTAELSTSSQSIVQPEVTGPPPYSGTPAFRTLRPSSGFAPY